ncbi:MAG: thioredoxin family protein [Saprospiraceae bacterium]|nr:thioredoxin family protein [Saprospiraceae bacterium]
MKKWILFIVLFSIGLPQIYAQLKFNTYNKQLIAKAKAENKLIFYEFTASWCAPCREMKKDVFPSSKVGEVYNNNFVCIQIDVDRDPHNISNNYDISGIPAFVFTDASGKVIHTETGYHTVDEFIELAEIPLAYQNGTTTPVQDLIISYDSDPQNFEKKLQAFMDGEDWKDEEGASLLLALASNGQEYAIQHFEKNEATYVKVLGQNDVDMYLAELALSEIGDQLDAAIDNKQEPDWALIERILKKHLGDRYLKHMYELKSIHAYLVNEWVPYVKNAVRAAEEYGKSAKDDSEKGDIYMEVVLTIVDSEMDLERDITEQEEVDAYKILYPFLKETEKLVKIPSSDLYSELAYACMVLELEDEEDKYDKLEDQAIKREEQQK